MAKYNILIKNGTVFDGKGNAPKKTDIGIKKDKIKVIGDLQKEDADKIIDANGYYVSPGFIDLTTHSDTHWTLFLYPYQESFVRQGITTILGGNCGLSLAPLVKGREIEGIKKWVDVSKINVNWKTMEEFFKEMENLQLPLNFCTLVGFNTLHWGVMGNESKVPTNDEINQMKFLLHDSIKNGAFGISTSFGTMNRTPSIDRELTEMLKIITETGSISKHHLEDEGKDILPSLSRLITFARESKSKLHISHLKALGRTAWGYFDNVLEMIDKSREEGIVITSDFFPYTRTGSNLSALLPPWIRYKGASEIIEIFRSADNNEKKKIIQHLKDMTLHYDRITIASTLHNWENIGKTISEISDLSGLSNEEVILDLLMTNNFQVSIFSDIISEENIEKLAIQKHAAIASDGVGYDTIGLDTKNDLPHPRSFGTFPRALNLFVKERKILSWEEIIHKMTELPAQILSLKNRGIIKENNYADIVVFDPESISDYSRYEAPYQFSKGIINVLINGKIVVDENKIIEKSAGLLLRKE